MTEPTVLDPDRPEEEAEVAAAAHGRPHLVRRVLSTPTAAASIAFLALVVLTAILAPLLAPHSPNTPNAADVLAPLSADHPLGGDSAGRDVLSRLLYASRFSIAGALLALVVAAVLGVTNGLLAGYYAKLFDAVSSWVAGLLQALPAIIVLLAARAVLGPSMWLSMTVFGVLLSPAFYRLLYAAVSAVRGELYVDAARVAGLGDGRIIARHILTVVRAPVIIQASILLSIAIAIQSGLEFLGLGDLTIPTWGSMLNDGFANIYGDPLLMLWPSLAIALTSMSLVLLANTLRDELEQTTGPKRGRKHRGPSTIEVTHEAVEVHQDASDEALGEELLSVRDLAVGYDTGHGHIKTVVEDVTLFVRRGEVHGLIGESGSGKTQTAFSVMGLLPEGGRIVHGSVVFEGQEISGLSERELARLRGRKIAYVPQEPMSNLDPSFRIGSQLTEPMRVNLGLGRREAKARALELLGKVGIPNPERTFAAYPHEISGGMAQRVLIAGAISCDPDLLIADEPTTALDVTVQAEVLDLLRDLQRELDMGVVLVTHNFGVVADLCDRVSVMRGGRIVETGPVGAIFAEPRHEYTRSLFDAILEGGDARSPLAEPAAAPDPHDPATRKVDAR